MKPDEHPQPTQMISLQKIIPNMLTLMALIAAVTSVQMAIKGEFGTAVLMLLAAAILDVLDGAAARALKSQSEFGAQLDSLSDFLAFGVAPSLILHIWVLDDAGKLGWIATIVLPVAAALRLARFNVMARKIDDIAAWKRKYFSGVPAPAGAGLILMPVYIDMLTPETFNILSFATPLIAIWVIIVSALMVSRLPTFALKSVRVPSNMMVPVMGLLCLLIAALVHAPWVMLTFLSVTYLISIPIVLLQYRRKEKEYHSHPEDLSSLAFGGTPMVDLGDEAEDKTTR